MTMTYLRVLLPSFEDTATSWAPTDTQPTGRMKREREHLPLHVVINIRWRVEYLEPQQSARKTKIRSEIAYRRRHR